MHLVVKKFLRLLISVVLIVVLIIKTDFTQALGVLVAANPTWILVGLLGIAGNILISAWRLRYILYIFKLNKSIPYLMKLYLIGNFYNNFLPTQMGGDVYKAYRLSKDLGKSGEGTFTIFMDRFSGLVILFFISLIGLFLKFGVKGLVLSFSFFVVCVVGYFVGLKLFSKKIPFVAKFEKANSIFLANRDRALGVFVTALAVQFFALLTSGSSFYAVGATVPIWSIFLYVPIITIMGLIPSINGVGVQDFGYIFFFGALGIIQEQAFAASILFHLMRFGVSLVGGLLLLLPGRNES